MKKKLFLVYLWSVLLFLSSCTTLQPFSYDRLQAADVNFPSQVRTVGVINYVPQDKQEKDSIGGLWHGDGKVATETLAQEIAATNYFDQVIVCDSALRGPEHEVEEFLPAYRVDSLFSVLGVDLLFAVEQVPVELKNGSIFIPEIMANLHVIIVNPVVRAYIAGRDMPLFSVSKSDTIFWELSSDLTYGQMIKEASEHAAMLPVKFLLPHWEEVSRYYFDGGNVEMRDAGVYVREGEWEEAAVLWKKIYDKKKGKAKMRAGYNLAVYSEMKDDFAGAEEYLNTAYELSDENSWEQQLILLYRLKLEIEHQNNQRLNVQMKRFGP